MPRVIPLPIYPTHEPFIPQLRRAKATLGDVPFQVLPRPAVPGSPGRVIAMGSKPNFICDYAPVSDPDNEESVLAALRWVTNANNMDERAVYVIDMLKEIFGADLKEIPREEWTLTEISKNMKLDKDKGVAFK